MSTGSRTRKFAAAVCAVTLGGVLGVAELASAQTSVIKTGGYLAFPKIVAHTTSPDASPALVAGEFAKDTVIQLTNVSSGSEPITVNCYYINANGHCGSPPADGAQVCRDDADCPAGVRCLPGWATQDFQFQLTPNQPLGWVISEGLDALPCEGNASCQTFQNGIIPPVNEVPFVGELRCLQVASSVDDTPVAENNLKGEATIVEAGPLPIAADTSEVLAAAYNAVSFEAESAGSSAGDALCLGGTPTGATCLATYTPCASTLSVQHFFDGAETPQGFVETELTLSPCSATIEDGGSIVPDNRVAALILVYNEFEQRFSTGTVLSCVEHIRLVDIDTPAGPAGDDFSVFAVGTQGTLGGQTRIKGENSSDDGFGPGLLGLVHQYYSDEGGTRTASSAHHVNGRFPPEPIVDGVYFP